MNIQEVLSLPSMPAASPSYPLGPYHFVNREYFIVTYVTDPEALRWAVPEPLEPDGSNTVLYEFISMPDSFGFGAYSESGVVIPCIYRGEPVNFTSQMYLDCHPPVAGGREIWGFPKKSADTKLCVVGDTLTGTLSYAGQQVALGTMGYKHNNLIPDGDCAGIVINKISKTQVNLKVIPGVTGKPEIAQLVAYNLEEVKLKGAWSGPARLHLVPHVNAPIADCPVRQIIGGVHLLADLVLPHGRVLYDYIDQHGL